MHEIPLILLGIGGVGRALVRQIIANRMLHAKRYGLKLGLLAVCDRTGAVLDLGGGIDDDTLQDLIDLKEAGGALGEHALGSDDYDDISTIVTLAGRPGAIVVDVTAADATIPALLVARERGYKIALANKKPLTDTQEVYNRLTQAGVTGDRRATHFQQSVRWEATVGAGLPVIATQNRLVASGDEITRMAGAFSGTLGYVMTGLQAGRRLSEIVREAHQLGYTEPDPRDDLGGMDVARKALILARGLGWELELEDVEVTGLYPPTMDDLSVGEFLDELSDLDQAMASTIRDAANQGGVLRYAATVENGRCFVGPTVVDADSPLGRLTGTDNLAEFHSRWYSPNPLVLQGRGAGVDATAAGVLSDVIELAFTSE